MLTRRELDVLDLVADGFTDEEVAKKLGIARSTVRTHLESIFKKMAVRNRTAAARSYRESSAKE